MANLGIDTLDEKSFDALTEQDFDAMQETPSAANPSEGSSGSEGIAIGIGLGIGL